MKRTISLFLIILLCLSFTVISFGEYVVEDNQNQYNGEDNQDSDSGDSGDSGAPTTAVTTTSKSQLDDYFSKITGALDSGLNSLLSGLKGNSQTTQSSTTTTTVVATTSSGLKDAQGYGSATSTVASGATAASQAQTTNQAAVQTTTASVATTAENVTIAGVNSADNGNNSSLSGSALTIVVFVAAVAILLLAIVVVLVIITRKTSFNSEVMNKSTLPSVDKPKTPSAYSNDDIADDGKDYSDISYWDGSKHSGNNA